MFGEPTKGILQVSSDTSFYTELEETAEIIVYCFEKTERISREVLRDLYGQTNSVAYMVFYHGTPPNLRIVSAVCPETGIVYAYRNPDGYFIREVWSGGTVTVTHRFTCEPDSILRALMWGCDEQL